MTDEEIVLEKKKRPYSWLIFAALIFALITLNIAAVFQLSEQTRVEREAAELHEEKVRRGAAKYVANCARCHEDDGSGSELAPSLNDIVFLSTVSNEFLQHTITEGRPRTIMPAWGQDEGGSLTDQDIEEVVTFIRNWENPVVEMGRTLTASGLPADSLEGGRESFLWYCAECHGDEGQIPNGVDDIVANSPERLRNRTEAEQREQVLFGGAEMPGLSNLLSPAELEGIMKLINSWPR
jgi:mono/diheme cytochrome c family protein